MTYRPVMLLLCLFIHGLALSGCGVLNKGLKSEEASEVRLQKILLERAIEHERKGEFQQALQVYEAALAVVAARKGGLEASLRNNSEIHYKRGLEFKKQGQYAKARHEFLVALRLWPEFPEVVEQLRPTQPTRPSRYVVHKVKEGEFLSAIAQKYYHDKSKYEIIASYNNLEDAAKLYAGMELKIPEIAGVSFGPARRKPASQPAAGDNDLGKMGVNVEEKPTGGVAGKITRKEGGAQPAGRGGTTTYPLASDEPTVSLEEEMDYDPVAIYQELGVSLLEDGQYLAALHEFQKVLNTDPSRKQVRKYMARAHHRQGVVLFQRAEYLGARRHFQEALSLDEQCSSCKEYLIRSEAAYKEYLIRSEAAYKEAHYLKGIQHFEEQSLKKAIEEWQLVRELDPDYKQVQSYLLRAQKLLDKVQELKETP